MLGGSYKAAQFLQLWKQGGSFNCSSESLISLFPFASRRLSWGEAYIPQVLPINHSSLSRLRPFSTPSCCQSPFLSQRRPCLRVNSCPRKHAGPFLRSWRSREVFTGQQHQMAKQLTMLQQVSCTSTHSAHQPYNHVVGNPPVFVGSATSPQTGDANTLCIAYSYSQGFLW